MPPATIPGDVVSRAAVGWVVALERTDPDQEFFFRRPILSWGTAGSAAVGHFKWVRHHAARAPDRPFPSLPPAQ